MKIPRLDRDHRDLKTVESDGRRLDLLGDPVVQAAPGDRAFRFSRRYTDEKEVRHVFNVTGSGGILPDEDVPGFRSAVDELARDFKQLSAMLLTVMAFSFYPRWFLSL